MEPLTLKKFDRYAHDCRTCTRALLCSVVNTKKERVVADLTLYFAYGSNLSPRQMYSRCPSSRVFGVAYLHDHALVFRGNSPRWNGGGVASLVRKDDHVVSGLLYVMKSKDLAKLDAYEGAPSYYQRTQRVVVDQHNARWRAHTYLLPPDRATRNTPSVKYLQQMADAYSRFGLPHSQLRSALDRSAPLGLKPVAQHLVLCGRSA